jgi:dTDP-4-amino-4,6-dideoxygalactose transaminase
MSYKSIKHNPYKIVQMFEEEVAEYTGAPYAVAVDSCTNAIFLCLSYWKDHKWISYPSVQVPKQTYLSVPMMAMQLGYKVEFVDEKWSGEYSLYPTNIWDSAKRFTSNMYLPGQMQCLSFHIKKLLPLGKGGMILTDDENAVKWLKCARYEGRNEVNYKDDDIKMLGWNMYMDPQVAARGLALMQNYPEYVEDLGENGGYRDLTEFSVFKGIKCA